MNTLPSLASLLLVIALATAAPETPLPVTTAIFSSTGSGDSFAPAFSPDGRFVAFVSHAKNLATNDAPSPWLDVYVHDLETGRTELVSVSSNGLGGGNGNSMHPSISSNGLFIAFESEAPNLAVNDTNGWRDVFLRNVAAGMTTRVSISTNGLASARFPSGSPLISADGERVIFGSTAWNLVTNDVNLFASDIFLRDRESGVTTALSVAPDGTSTGLGRNDGVNIRSESLDAAIAGDGQRVAFFSNATNLVAGFPNARGEGIFVRDVMENMTHWVSVHVDGFTWTNYSSYASYPPSISADGRFAFMRVWSSSGRPLLLRYDIQTTNTTLIASNLLEHPAAAFSGNGRFVAVATTNALVLLDTETETSQTICGDGVMPELKAWRSPAVSADGQRVAFAASTSTNGSWSAYVFDRTVQSSQLVSVTTNGTPAEIDPSAMPIISLDGRRVAFESRAADIVAGDWNHATDIFVRNLSDNTTHLVSAAVVPSTTPALRSSIGSGSVSDFAQRIAFTTLDPSLAEESGNRWHSVIVRDRVNGTNHAPATEVSRALGTNRTAFNPLLSANGRYVAWLEHASTLHNPPPFATNIHWLDLETGAERTLSLTVHQHGGPLFALSRDGRWIAFTDRVQGSPFLQVLRRDMFSADSTNELVSVNLNTGTGPGTADSHTPVFTPDGRWLVYLHRLSSFTPSLIARDLSTGQRHLAGNNEFGFAQSWVPRMIRSSGNSRYLVMQGGNNGNQIFRHDLSARSHTNVLVCANCSNPAIDNDGNVVVFQQRSASGTLDIFERDLRTGQTLLISSNLFGATPSGGNQDSFPPLISGDGRYIVFASRATNLVAGDTNMATDIFVHDRTTRATMLVSRNASGEPARGSSASPVLSPDGRSIVFSSAASDLVPNDFNNARDLFVLRLGGTDSDFDGIDDDWEQTYFTTLARDGHGDFDSDGAPDRHEFLAGTDPTNSGSIFRVLTVERAEGNGRLVLWQTLPGRRYLVQFTDNLNDAYWNDLGSVTAADSTATLLDDQPPTQRIYRVRLQP